MIDKKLIGQRCQDFRENVGLLQIDVARDTGYSIENVSSFERGRNDNYRILLWYVLRGLSLEDLIRGVNYGENL